MDWFSLVLVGGVDITPVFFFAVFFSFCLGLQKELFPPLE